MRIDIIHMRDPDSSCDHEVYVDGKRVGSVYGVDTDPAITVKFWSFDPGAGYDRTDIAESKAENIAAAPDFLKATIEQIWDEMEPSYEKWGF
jgi:hypothetical protein